MAFTAADVGGRIDLLLNGEGYMYSEPESTKAQYGFTPTYVTRQNTQGDYGDNFQDFWLTSTQRDWSLGDGQRFFRANDEDSRRRYFGGSGIDITVPGQVNLGTKMATNASLAGSVVAAWPNGYQTNGNSYAAYATSTTMYYMGNAGTEVSVSAHGLGVAPTCGCRDYDFDYVSSSKSGTNGIRRYSGAAWSTFSATGVDSMCFVNNTLFGFQGISGGAANAILYRYDTSGTATAVQTWKNSNGGNARLGGNIIAYGGKVLILLDTYGESLPNGPELWVYDGVGASKLAEIGQGTKSGLSVGQFYTPMAVSNGVVYVGVTYGKGGSSGTSGKAAIWYYANGTTGTLWIDNDAYTYGSVSPVSFNGGVLWSVQASGKAYFYDPEDGAINQVYTHSTSPFPSALVGLNSYAVALGGSRADVLYGYSGTQFATSGTVTSSQFDFDSSLTKIFRSIKVEFETASGGSVDISYQVDGVGGTYTSLQTGATSGTEYTISSTTGKTISVKVTLNGSGSNAGPTLKRVSVRAAPLQGSYNKNTYVLQLGGVDGKNGQQLRDGTYHYLDGHSQATNLRTVATTATPVTVVDRFGSYTGVIENEGFQLREYAPDEFIAVVPVRQV